MKTLKSAFLLTVIITGISCFEAKGQVTIGSDKAPLPGVLLDIKSDNATQPGGATVTGTNGGGLGLPRVSLTSETSLSPFYTLTDVNELKNRTGLMVYNVSTIAPFKPGVYIWDGAKWNVAGGGVKWFYMPACNVSTTSTLINLYDIYKEQFTKQGNTKWASNNGTITHIPSPYGDKLYESNELDYVVTYYDSSVFPTVSISNAGVMTYTVSSNPTITSATYFNI
ncbi:MAG: hypothetical protein LBB84_09420, partial [Tannerellaceae bacterium]|nr:hypothetical protein [Tannerellaceae bacterium]